MDYINEKDFIKRMSKGVMLEEYTLTDMLWFMKNYKDQEVSKLLVEHFTKIKAK